MAKLGKAKRLKTTINSLDNPNATRGETVTVIRGAFEGWTGKVVDFDGIWRTIEAN